MISASLQEWPRLLIRHDFLVFGLPVRVDAVPAIAFEFVTALRADLPVGIRLGNLLHDAVEVLFGLVGF